MSERERRWWSVRLSEAATVFALVSFGAIWWGSLQLSLAALIVSVVSLAAAKLLWRTRR